MKISFLAAVGAACLFSVSALHAQTATTTTRTNRGTTVARSASNTITKNRRTVITKTTQPVVVLAPRTDGVIPRAIRSGSPLQMINPFAPASYGGGQEVANHAPADPYAKPQGIKLATIDF